MDAPISSQKRRPRISLLSLLLIMATIALGVTTYKLSQEVVPLRAENRRLNEERGTLQVADPSKVNAIQVPSHFAGQPEGQVSFRVQVPKGKQYVAIVAVNQIPKKGFPEVERRESAGMILGQAGPNAFAVLPPGENLVSVGSRWHGGRNHIRFAAKTARTVIPLSMHLQSPEDRWPAVKPEAFSNYGEQVGRSTESFDPTQPIVLYRRRVQPISSERLRQTFAIIEPAHLLGGFMLWIEPLPVTPPNR